MGVILSTGAVYERLFEGVQSTWLVCLLTPFR